MEEMFRVLILVPIMFKAIQQLLNANIIICHYDYETLKMFQTQYTTTSHTQILPTYGYLEFKIQTYFIERNLKFHDRAKQQNV
jgi:hypothetical protein